MPIAPASPPKRMTRARTKAVEGTQTTAKKSTATAATASSKRKAKSDDQDADTSKAPATATAAEPKPRGRPRKNTVSKDSPAATATATTTTAKSRATASTAATRKKVTFQDADDKENTKQAAAAPAKKPTKAQPAKSAMALKPVRKAAAAASKKTSTQPRVPSPLSPKKDTQVAKGNATAADDDSGDELGLDCEPGSSTPTQNKLSGAPAKRPPPSPFRNSLKESPRKMAITVPPPFAEPQAATGATTPPRTMLSQSPRKIMLGSSVRDNQFKAPIEPLGASLFKSPARRPASPVKGFPGFPLGSPSRIDSQGLDLTASVLKSKTPQRFNFSPAKNLTRAFKAAKTDGSFKLDVDELANSASSKSDSLVESEAEADETKEAAAEQDVTTKAPSPTGREQDGQAAEFAFAELDEAIPDMLGDESEDELHGDSSIFQAASPSAKKSRLSSHFRPVSPSAVATPQPPAVAAPEAETLTGLAVRFGQWQGATPDSAIVSRRRAERSMFSPPQQLSQLSLEEDEVDDVSSEHAADDNDEEMADYQAESEQIPMEMPEPSTFGEEFIIAEDEDELMMDVDAEREQDPFRQSQMTEASQEYGDENVAPVEPVIVPPQPPAAITCTPSNTMSNRRDVVHTVSRVPLKPAADYDTPLQVAKKRSHSLSGKLTPRSDLDLQAMRQIYPSADALEHEQDQSDVASIATATSKLGQTLAPSEATPRRSPSGSFFTGMTPGKADRQLLKGAVVYVDVHTAEGADANSIFVELLTQMGAKCVKQWNWNSRSSVGPSSPDSDQGEEASGKVGITHVVFKDGGKRTMEKVRQAKGRVHCVGVGWVLDCERENRWVDEAEYEVDNSLIPRGGHRRRKSMEPKSLLSRRASTSALSSPRKVSPQMSPTKEFLNLSTPVRRETIGVAVKDRRGSFAPSAEMSDDDLVSTPPAAAGVQYTTPPGLGGYAESSFGSPTTPYFLHPTQLVQQTCPPKQHQELFFPVSGRIDEADDRLKQRLQLARRKSLQFVPKVGSPLGRKL